MQIHSKVVDHNKIEVVLGVVRKNYGIPDSEEFNHSRSHKYHESRYLVGYILYHVLLEPLESSSIALGHSVKSCSNLDRYKVFFLSRIEDPNFKKKYDDIIFEINKLLNLKKDFVDPNAKKNTKIFLEDDKFNRLLDVVWGICMSSRTLTSPSYSECALLTKDIVIHMAYHKLNIDPHHLQTKFGVDEQSVFSSLGRIHHCLGKGYEDHVHVKGLIDKIAAVLQF